jgi:hypothetical protein
MHAIILSSRPAALHLLMLILEIDGNMAYFGASDRRHLPISQLDSPPSIFLRHKVRHQIPAPHQLQTPQYPSL